MGKPSDASTRNHEDTYRGIRGFARGFYNIYILCSIYVLYMCIYIYINIYSLCELESYFTKPFKILKSFPEIDFLGNNFTLGYLP